MLSDYLLVLNMGDLTRHIEFLSELDSVSEYVNNNVCSMGMGVCFVSCK